MAGKYGNVYKKADDGWLKYDNGSWTSQEKPAQSTGNPATVNNNATGSQKQSRGQSPTASSQPAGKQAPAKNPSASTYNANRKPKVCPGRYSRYNVIAFGIITGCRHEP